MALLKLQRLLANADTRGENSVSFGAIIKARGAQDCGDGHFTVCGVRERRITGSAMC